MSLVSTSTKRILMKTKLLGSVILASTITTASNADVQLFGHLGVLYNQGFGDVKIAGDNINYGGLTGHLGVDIGSSNVGFGVGGWGGTQLWGTQDYAKNFVYGDQYIDLSDLYFRYNGQFDFYAGRFDGHFLKADWIDNYIQGVGLSWKLGQNSNIWVTWANDYTTYGVLPGRIASELQAYRRFPSSFNNFGVGDWDLIAGGANLDFDILQIDPFVHYFLGTPNAWRINYGDGNNTLQAGARAALMLGGSGFKSTTAARFMWQNNYTNTFLFWIDEELRFSEIFKLGAGWYIVGKDSGIYTITDHSRFYGRYTIHSMGYFGANTNSWYVFGGVEHKRVKFDVLYAGGGYNEFSAVASVRVLDYQLGFMREGLAVDVGAGYVGNGFGDNNIQYHNAIAFAKLVF